MQDDKNEAGTRVKGTMSWGLLHFGVKNVLKFKLNVFSRTQNTPKNMPREGNSMISQRKN